MKVTLGKVLGAGQGDLRRQIKEGEKAAREERKASIAKKKRRAELEAMGFKPIKGA